MIKIIYGPKGTGKTKTLIDEANNIIDTSDYMIAGEEALCGFVKGVVAANNDNEYLFIDGAARIAGKDIKDMAAFYYMLDRLCETNGLTIYVTCSCSKEELPDFVAKYL